MSKRHTSGWLAGAALIAALVMLSARYSACLFDDDDRLARERVLRRAIFAAKGVLPATPDLARLDQRLAESGMQSGAPALLRIFKQEFELEVWLRKGQRFEKFATYPICNFSGALGPKLQEGDRQSPEGFYTVDATALNPNSRWHKSFNLGFPNALDRAHQRTGSYLMVHGGCSSIGCYAMTDAVIDEIWRLVTAALRSGQPRFQVQVYPFRMTDAALAAKRNSPWIAFWHDLKQGNDAFLASGQPPVVAVCQGRYVVLNTPEATRRSETRLVASGCPAS